MFSLFLKGKSHIKWQDWLCAQCMCNLSDSWSIKFVFRMSVRLKKWWFMRNFWSKIHRMSSSWPTVLTTFHYVFVLLVGFKMLRLFNEWKAKKKSHKYALGPSLRLQMSCGIVQETDRHCQERHCTKMLSMESMIDHFSNCKSVMDLYEWQKMKWKPCLEMYIFSVFLSLDVRRLFRKQWSKMLPWASKQQNSVIVLKTDAFFPTILDISFAIWQVCGEKLWWKIWIGNWEYKKSKKKKKKKKKSYVKALEQQL